MKFTFFTVVASAVVRSVKLSITPSSLEPLITFQKVIEHAISETHMQDQQLTALILPEDKDEG